MHGQRRLTISISKSTLILVSMNQGIIHFVSRTRVWRLKEEAVREKFREVVESREQNRNTVDSEISVEGLWSGLRDCMNEASEAVCGRTKGQQVHKETWWWNEEVGKAVEEKREWHRIWSKSKTEANKMVYNQMKKYAGKVVSLAKESYGKKLVRCWIMRQGKATCSRQ